LSLAALLAVRGVLWAAPPGFSYGLDYPSANISPYPKEKPIYSASLSYRDYPLLKGRLQTKINVKHSSFEYSSITFQGAWYKKGRYSYFYTARSVEARSFLEYRKKMNLRSRMIETTNRALAKDQKDKAGGLFSLNIPIKSKAMESLFGEGGAGLKVSGYHQITLSGRSQWDDRTETATFRQNKFPSLNMEQVSRFDINGTIGSKITVSVSQDSKTDIPLANRLMIRYKGDEDDIIKTIEAGNTTLSLPNTQFVGYSTRIKGLFGLKSTAQIGGLELTAIASQEKGSSERTTIAAGGASNKNYIRDWAYLDGKIFDLGRLSGENADFFQGDEILEIAVYKQVKSNIGDALGTDAEMYVDPYDTSFASSETEKAIVENVESIDYYVDNNDFWIMFNSPNAGTYGSPLGVWMVVKRADGVTVDTIGNVLEIPYELKLIKAKSPSSAKKTFEYAWKNVYSLGSGRLELDGLEIRIYKGLPNTERTEDNLDENEAGVKYIQILKLDTLDNSGNAGSDGLIDKHTEIILPDQNLLIFPDREPFNNPDLEQPVNEIYTFSRGSTQMLEASTYYLEVVSLSRSNEISLGKPNIIEGSERITLNGEILQKGVDYNINYDFGRVTFLSDRATDANADLAIDFEYSPFIQTQKKTLFGLRGEYEFSRNLKFGTTVLYKSDKATQRKPKIGQETSRMFVWDADLSFKIKPNFLTTMANALPFFNTEAESNLAVSAEVAQSHPNPNVEGVAYLDDFEGSRETYSLSIFRESWNYASKPVQLDDGRLRAWMNWYNPYDRILTREIWQKEVTTTDSRTHVLHLYVEPETIDRRVGNVDSTLEIINPADSWAGIMRGLVGGATNLTRADMLELRTRGQKGILHIDLGSISEDINGDGMENNEDDLGGPKNGSLDDDEDYGLDTLKNEDEPGYDPDTNPDPHQDDWFYSANTNPYDYRHINGTEGNREDGGTLALPDKDDFNRDGVSDSRNSYFSYSYDLSDDNSGFYVENSRNIFGWGTYRIPLKDSTLIDEIIGVPVWEDVNFVRIWIESPLGDTIDFEIASAEIVSPNWKDTIATPEFYDVDDPVNTKRFSVAVIGTQDNDILADDVDPDTLEYFYVSPPGVAGEYNRTTQISEPEQSLLLNFENLMNYDLSAADTALAERVLFDTPNLMGYGSLKLWIRAPEEISTGNKLMFLFRIGQDNGDYYEVRKVFDTAQWVDLKGWMDVTMNFDDITGLKFTLDSLRKANPEINHIDSTIAGNSYRIFGKPTITKVKYLAFGVVPLEGNVLVDGNIWIDELRLTDVRTDVGTAARISLSGNVADLFTYNAGYNYTNSYFRKISGSLNSSSSNNLGSGKTLNSYSYGISFKLDRFMPRSLKASIPISYRFSKNTSTPRLKFNSDIVLPENKRFDERTQSISKSFSISESFKKKTKNPLFTVLLNSMRNSFSYSRSDGISPSTPMSMSENYSVKTTYTLNFGKPPNIRPFFWTKPIPIFNRMSENKFYLMPLNIGLTSNLVRSLRISRNVNGILTNNLTKTFQGTFKASYKISDNLTANYHMDTRRDLSNPDLINLTFDPKKFKLGRETQYSQTFNIGYTPAVFGFLTHKFNYSVNYNENFKISNDTRDMSSNKSYGVAGNLDLKKFFGGKSSRRRSSTRVRQRDKGVIKAEAKKNIFQKLVDKPAAVMRFMTGWIDPFTYDFKESYRYSFIGLLERAQLKFRFGLTDDIAAEINPESQSAGRSTTTTKITSFSFGSGTRLLGGLKTGVTFKRTINQDIVKAVNPTKSISTTFPDISFTINQLTTFTFLNPLIRKLAPRTKYSRSTKESHNLTTGFKTSEETTTSQNPLLSFTFDLVRGLQLNVRTNRTVSESKSFNSSTGEVTRKSRSTSTNASASTKYSFSWPTGVRFPIFGRLKFRSTMAISIEVSVRQQNREEATGGAELVSKGENQDFMVTPTISYNFSSQIKGGISGRWQDTNNKQQNRKSHVRELRVWVDIRF